MKSETREQIIEGLLQSFAFVGAENYEASMKMLEAGVIKFLEGVRSMNSVEKLRQLFEDLELTEAEEKILLGAVQSAPALIAMFIRQVGETAETTLPGPELGRPAVGFFKREKILDFITLKMRAGCSLKQAKARAALRFDLSSATIQRIWNERGADNLPDATAIFEALHDGTLDISANQIKAENS